jgi:hypothetical protein
MSATHAQAITVVGIGVRDMAPIIAVRAIPLMGVHVELRVPRPQIPPSPPPQNPQLPPVAHPGQQILPSLATPVPAAAPQIFHACPGQPK